MYVCLCNSLTSADVRRACGAGAATPAAVYQHMGCKPQCGKCRDSISELLASGPSAVRAPERKAA